MRKQFRILCIFLCLACLFTVIDIKIAADEVVKGAALNGQGTAASPFEIHSAQELELITKGDYPLSASYKIMQNIDCSGMTFSPIGGNRNEFTGVFDGGGKTVSNLRIEGSGMFGETSGAVIKNLTLKNVSVDANGLSAAGGIAGVNGGSLVNCAVTGNSGVTGYNSSVGGLVGFNKSRVENSFFNGRITAYGGEAGGLAAKSSGIIQYCYAEANITVNSATGAGGLVSRLVDGASAPRVSNSYAAGSITGSGGTIGGLIGSVECDSRARVQACYAAVSVPNGADGFVGKSGNADYNECVFNSTLYGNDSSISGITSMNEQSIIDWLQSVFLNGWETSPGSSLPYLPGVGTVQSCLVTGQNKIIGNTSIRLQVNVYPEVSNLRINWRTSDPTILSIIPVADDPRSVDVYALKQGKATVYATANDVEAPPFSIDCLADGEIQNITNMSQLLKIELDGNYRLTADIDASGAAFRPIGTNEQPFNGTFDGGGKTIRGLNISGDFAGLFGVIGSGSVKGIVLKDALVSGVKAAGSIAGKNVSGTIEKCYAFGKLGSAEVSGGLAGINGGNVISSFFSGNIDGSFRETGGLIGHNSGTVSECYAAAELSNSLAGGNTGGFAGTVSGGRIKNCYAVGGISAGSGRVGGFAGQTLPESQINACYCAMDMSGAPYAKAFAGDNSGETSQCYFESSGLVSGAEGASEADLHQLPSAFTTGWAIQSGAYPYLKNIPSAQTAAVNNVKELAKGDKLTITPVFYPAKPLGSPSFKMNEQSFINIADSANGAITIEALEAGEAKLYVRADAGWTKLQEIRVSEKEASDKPSTPKPAPTIKLINPPKQMYVGQKLKISVDVKNAVEPVKFVITPSKSAVIDKNHVLTAKQLGKLTLFAFTGSAHCEITINVVKLPASVSVYDTLVLKKGASAILKAKVLPSDAFNKKVTWKSGNVKIAKVNAKGKVTAVKPGKCRITVSTVEGKRKAVCYVTVGTPVTSIKLGAKKLTLKQGKSANIKVLFTPDKASVKAITYSISNTKIAKINKTGKVTALKKGKCVVTVISKDGRKKASCSLVVVG